MDKVHRKRDRAREIRQRAENYLTRGRSQFETDTQRRMGTKERLKATLDSDNVVVFPLLPCHGAYEIKIVLTCEIIYFHCLDINSAFFIF